MSVRSSGPAGLRLRPVLLGCLNSLGTTASFSGLFKAGVHYVPARPCQLIAVSCCFPYFGHPLCAISCLTIAIYAMPSPPRAYQRRKGDSFINYHYTKRRAGRVCVYIWVSFVPRPQLLGPCQGSPLLERRQGNCTVYLSRLPGSIR